MPMVVILMGPTGCGKSTVGRLLAQRLGWPFFDADDFHSRANVEKMRAGIPLTDADRVPWLERLHQEIQGWMSGGQSTVLACSALKQSYRDQLGVDQAKVVTVYLKGDYELIRKRIGSRLHPYMPADLLESQFAALEEPVDGIRVDITAAPRAIVQTIVASLHLEAPDPESRNHARGGK